MNNLQLIIVGNAGGNVAPGGTSRAVHPQTLLAHFVAPLKPSTQARKRCG
jgi:hypothetical protein